MSRDALLKSTLPILAAGLLACGVPAAAQISPQSGVINFGADSQRWEGQTQTMYLDGKVEFLQDGARLRCDHAIVRSADDGEIAGIEAEGNIYYITKDAAGQDNVVRGDHAVYTRSGDTLVMTGEVILMQGRNVTTGTRLVAEIGKGTTTFSDPGGRVKGIFYPGAAKP